jgi:hypothetical protein
VDAREAPALRRRDEIREYASGSLLAVGVIFAWSIVAPVRIEIVDPFERDWGRVLPGLLFVAAFMTGVLGWILVIERRRPWPMAQPVSGRSWFAGIVLFFAIAFTGLWAWENWPAVIYFPNPADPPSPTFTVQPEYGDAIAESSVNTMIRVSIPENEARGWILITLVAWVAYSCAWLLVEVSRNVRRRRPKPLDASTA